MTLQEKTAFELQHDAATDHPLEEILNECLNQVTSGKGNERHGNGREFMDQPWRRIADIHGHGFLTGQAAKKLDEAQGFDDLSRWNREMYGVIAYAAMAIYYRNKIKNG